MKSRFSKVLLAGTVILIVLCLFPSSAFSAGLISSPVYIVDRENGTLGGIPAGTSLDTLISNISNDKSEVKVRDRNGALLTEGNAATGMSVNLEAGGAAADSLKLSVKGDVNGDGQITVSDYTLIKLSVLGLKALAAEYRAAADVNGDGDVTIGDCALMRLYMLGLKRIIPNPALPLSGCAIGLDPGHQARANYDKERNSPGGSRRKAKVSSGTRGRFTKIYEYVINLQVALKLKEKLEGLGATVIMTRESHKVDISNAERAKMMNEANVDCWLRIHANGNNKKSIYGMMMLVPRKGCLDTSDLSVYGESIRLGQALLDSAAAAAGAKSLGLKPRSDQTGFNWSQRPVCNIEMGYMTNKNEDLLLTSGEYQEKIAQGLADGFVDYFNG